MQGSRDTVNGGLGVVKRGLMKTEEEIKETELK